MDNNEVTISNETVINKETATEQKIEDDGSKADNIDEIKAKEQLHVEQEEKIKEKEAKIKEQINARKEKEEKMFHEQLTNIIRKIYNSLDKRFKDDQLDLVKRQVEVLFALIEQTENTYRYSKDYRDAIDIVLSLIVGGKFI